MKKLFLLGMTSVVVLLSAMFFIGHAPAETHKANVAAEAEPQNVWDGQTTKMPTSRTTIDSIYYYEISSAEELAYIAKTGGDWLGYNYILTDDIFLNKEKLTYDKNTSELTVENVEILNEWTPIGDYHDVGFTGIFNGAGHAISGVYIKSQLEYSGFFADCSGDIIDLTIKDSYISGGDIIGGICGYFSGNMNKCYFYGAVIGELRVGGLIGQCASDIITQCGNYGDVWATASAKHWVNSEGETNVAGVAGYASAFLGDYIDCFNKGQIQSTGNATRDYVGGIVGYVLTELRIRNCKNSGNILSGNVTNKSYVGGIGGILAGSITDCKNIGNITGNDFVGGVAGLANSMFANASISNCYNYGNINGKNYVGGISGRGSSINNCGNIGNILGLDAVGGICGSSTASADYNNILTSYNSGSITGTTNVGGIIGDLHKDSVINDCYNIGEVIGESNIGSIIGNNNTIWGTGSISNCYYLKTDSINADLPAFGIGEVENGAESKDESFFCINSDRTLNLEGHKYSSNCDATCENCNYERTVAHNYNNLRHDEENHWMECECGEIDQESIAAHSGGTATCSEKAICSECGTAYGELNSENHKAASDWTTENGKHYHECLNGCGEHLEEANCSGGTATCSEKAICSECGAAYGELNNENHSAATSWTSQKGKHYHECLNRCGTHLEEADCVDIDSNGHCDICNTTLHIEGEESSDVGAEESQNDDELHTGLIVGISVGAAVVGGTSIFLICYFVKKKRRNI